MRKGGERERKDKGRLKREKEWKELEESWPLLFLFRRNQLQQSARLCKCGSSLQIGSHWVNFLGIRKLLYTGGPEMSVHNKNSYYDGTTGLSAFECFKGLICDREVLCYFPRLSCRSGARGHLCVWVGG